MTDVRDGRHQSDDVFFIGRACGRQSDRESGHRGTDAEVGFLGEPASGDDRKSTVTLHGPKPDNPRDYCPVRHAYTITSICFSTLHSG